MTVPGPRLPGFVQDQFYYAAPLDFLRFCGRRYGPVFQLRFPRIGPMVFLTDPGLIDQLYGLDGTDGHAGAVNSVLEPVTGRRSVLLMDREQHLDERRMLTSAFHGARLARLEGVVREAAVRGFDSWPDRGVVRSRATMQSVAFEIITRAVLGLDDPVMRRRLFTEMRPLLNISALLFIPALNRDLGPLSPGGRFWRARRRVDATLSELVADRRRTGPLDDALGAMLAAGERLSDEHILDELRTLIIAGYDTVASALTWGCLLLAHHPEAADEVRRGGVQAASAAVREVLRLRPVVIDVGRRLSAPVELGGHRIEAGVTVVPAVSLVQTDPSRHGDPETFRPSRFTDAHPGRHLWQPFGGGRRRCLGAGLAELELSVVLAELVERFDLAPVSKRLERGRVRGIALVPDRGGRVGVRRRH